MRKCDKIMFKECTKSLRKEIIKSYYIQRTTHADSEKKEKK